MVMGGFHLFKRVSEEQSDSQNISQENDDPLHPLLVGDLVRDDIYTFTMPTEKATGSLNPSFSSKRRGL